ncbi:unnamed protein product [Bursaphelenchus xylophilus]|uniref:(pine wood nematode) hypothetical protein n=1 Tax=Bursaphelenchus xylophilus TaxID=6326 RepID=A0A1I7RX47_BURXY|nr:unnamed protein product [Bursaphelenchus xylophilus]CAG9121319.1 unnamed protein product [Bursaphelenchus xylophilus]
MTTHPYRPFEPTTPPKSSYSILNKTKSMHLPVSHLPYDILPPPPYQSGSSDDASSGRYSDSSYRSPVKRHLSWNNIVDADDIIKQKVQMHPGNIGIYTVTGAGVNLNPYGSTTVGQTSWTTMPVHSDGGSLAGSQISVNTKHNPNIRPPQHTPGPVMAGSRPPSEALHPIGGSTLIEGGGKSPTPKKNRMQDLRNCWAKPSSKFCCLAILVLLIGAIIGTVVLTQVLALPTQLSWSWLPPPIERKNSDTPNRFRMQVAKEQVRIEQTGAPPFTSSYVSVLDFKTNKIAIMDNSVRNSGEMICFLMNLDLSDIRSVEQFQRAARIGATKEVQTNGWKETWTLIATPISNPMVSSQAFQPELAECRGAKWVELSRTGGNQKNFRCAECTDFCLPHYAIEHDNIRGEHYLNIKQRDCFYFFVPQWKGFAAAQQFNTAQSQQNQQRTLNNQGQFGQQPGQFGQQPGQFGQNPFPNNQNQFNNGQNGGGGGGFQSGINQIGQGIGQIGQAIGQNPTAQRVGNALESQWIQVQKVPGQIANFSAEAASDFRSNVDQWGQALFGSNNNNPQNQQNPPSPSQIFSQNPNNPGNIQNPGQSTFNNPTQNQIPFTARNIDSNPSSFNNPGFGSNIPNPNVNQQQFGQQLHEPGTAFNQPPLTTNQGVAKWNPRTGWQPEGQQNFGQDVNSQNNQQQPNQFGTSNWMSSAQG